MSQRLKRFAALTRVDKDKNGRPIPIYKISTVQKDKLTHEIETGKKQIKKVKL